MKQEANFKAKSVESGVHKHLSFLSHTLPHFSEQIVIYSLQNESFIFFISRPACSQHGVRLLPQLLFISAKVPVLGFDPERDWVKWRVTQSDDNPTVRKDSIVKAQCPGSCVVASICLCVLQG